MSFLTLPGLNGCLGATADSNGSQMLLELRNCVVSAQSFVAMTQVSIDELVFPVRFRKRPDLYSKLLRIPSRDSVHLRAPEIE